MPQLSERVDTEAQSVQKPPDAFIAPSMKSLNRLLNRHAPNSAYAATRVHNGERVIAVVGQDSTEAGQRVVGIADRVDARRESRRRLAQT